jgi:hypothetical protein
VFVFSLVGASIAFPSKLNFPSFTRIRYIPTGLQGMKIMNNTAALPVNSTQDKFSDGGPPRMKSSIILDFQISLYFVVLVTSDKAALIVSLNTPLSFNC